MTQGRETFSGVEGLGYLMQAGLGLCRNSDCPKD